MNKKTKGEKGRLPQLDHDGDGYPGGSLPKAAREAGQGEAGGAETGAPDLDHGSDEGIAGHGEAGQGATDGQAPQTPADGQQDSAPQGQRDPDRAAQHEAGDTGETGTAGAEGLALIDLEPIYISEGDYIVSVTNRGHYRRKVLDGVASAEFVAGDVEVNMVSGAVVVVPPGQRVPFRAALPDLDDDDDWALPEPQVFDGATAIDLAAIGAMGTMIVVALALGTTPPFAPDALRNGPLDQQPSEIAHAARYLAANRGADPASVPVELALRKLPGGSMTPGRTTIALWSAFARVFLLVLSILEDQERAEAEEAARLAAAQPTLPSADLADDLVNEPFAPA